MIKEKTSVNRIELCAAIENEKSQAVAERLGFKPEGIKRAAEFLNGQFVDHNIYSLLRNEM